MKNKAKAIIESVLWIVVLGAVSMTLYKRWTVELTEEARGVAVYSLAQKSEVHLPLNTPRPQILFFWATWCPPCKLEMYRLHQSIEAGKIPAEAVLAISVGESLETVQEFAKAHPYRFQYFASPDGAVTQVYQVPGTPTIYHLDSQQMVIWSTVGVNPLSIFKAESLFQ